MRSTRRPVSSSGDRAGSAGRRPAGIEDLDALQRAALEVRCQLAADGLDFGQLGHRLESSSRQPPGRRLQAAQSCGGVRGELGARMRVEVDVAQALGRQVGVDLGGADVGVAEHLLQRAQVAAAGQQVGGERVAQRVGAHAVLQPGAAGVALDDLVEPLAGERPPAEVDEHVRLVAQPDQPRPARARGRRCSVAIALHADRHQALLGALAAGAQHPGLEVELGQLQGDRLRGAQPAGVHRLEQRAVAQRAGRVAPGLVEQPVDLVAAEHLRQAAPRARRAQLGGRVVVDQLLAAQVAVEGAQAGDLALQRGRRDGRPAVAAGGELGDERRQVARASTASGSGPRRPRNSPNCCRSER